MTLLNLNTRLAYFYHQAPEQEQVNKSEEDLRSELRTACNELAYLIWIDQEGSRQWERIQLLDRSENGVGFESSRFVAVGQMVWVELEGELCRGAVRYINKTGERYRGGLLKIRVDRRLSEREPVLGTGTLQFSGLSTPAIIRNVSAGGVQVETAIKVPVSEVVRLSATNLDCLAITRYCQPQETQYVSGLEILPQAEDDTAA